MNISLSTVHAALNVPETRSNSILSTSRIPTAFLRLGCVAATAEMQLSLHHHQIEWAQARYRSYTFEASQCKPAERGSVKIVLSLGVKTTFLSLEELHSAFV